MLLKHCSIPPFQMSSSIFRLLQGGYCIFCCVTKCRSLQRLSMFLRLLEGTLMSNLYFFPLPPFCNPVWSMFTPCTSCRNTLFSTQITWLSVELCASCSEWAPLYIFLRFILMFVPLKSSLSRLLTLELDSDWELNVARIQIIRFVTFPPTCYFFFFLGGGRHVSGKMKAKN